MVRAAHWRAWRRRDERGATAVEYGLMIALMAIVIFGMVAAFGGGVVDLFGESHASIEGAITP